MRLYLVVREEPLLRRELFRPVLFSFGVLLTSCLITMVLLSYLPGLALGPILERLLFGR